MMRRCEDVTTSVYCLDWLFINYLSPSNKRTKSNFSDDICCTKVSFSPKYNSPDNNDSFSGPATLLNSCPNGDFICGATSVNFFNGANGKLNNARKVGSF